MLTKEYLINDYMTEEIYRIAYRIYRNRTGKDDSELKRADFKIIESIAYEVQNVIADLLITEDSEVNKFIDRLVKDEDIGIYERG